MFLSLPIRLRIPRAFLALAAGLLGSTVGWAAAGQQSYDLRAGDAEVTLKKFAAASGQQVVFLSEVTQGVRTNAVQGHYTARDALDLMLTGTPLVAKMDEPSGAFVVSRGPEQAPRMVSLPPYVVEATTARPPWRYAQVPGLEVLSLCSDDTTMRLITHNERLRELLSLILPRDFQARTDVPNAFVLYSQQWEPKMSQAVLGELKNIATKDAKARGLAAPGEISVQFMPNFQFCDQDSRALFAVIDEVGFGSGRMTLNSHYVRYLLQSRAPALPKWYVEGMMELYKVVTLESGPSADRVVFSSGSLVAAGTAAEPAATIGKLTWVDDAWTAQLRKNPKAKVEFIPLADLFSSQLPPGADKDYPARWRSQLALFLRWAMDPATKGAGREALWKLVRQAGAEPPTEALFRECFGTGFDLVEEELHGYQRAALRSSVTFTLPNQSDLPEVILREATDSEIGRLKGDLNRLEITYVKETIPALVEKYADQARQTLRKAYERGDRDPRLLAVMGLCEVDAGKDSVARPFLVAATAAKVIRPRAYYELARINLARLPASDPAVPLPAGPAQEILALLQAARRQAPPLPEVYALMGEVWLRRDVPLTPEQLAVFDEGLRLFPHWVRLITTAALLQARSGNVAEARALIGRGLRLSDQLVEKNRLLKLQDAIDAAVAQSGKRAP